MPKKTGIIFVVMGAVLMLSALLLFLYNDHEDRRAGQEAELLLADVQAVIAQKEEPTEEKAEETSPEETQTASEETVPGETAPEESLPEETLSPEMPTVKIGAYEYIGYLSIPELDLELPVIGEWSYNRLQIAPCRHFGSSRTDDLVIAAHNYKTHFGGLKNLPLGSVILFTDMDGIVTEYTLTRLERLAADAVDAVQNSGHDLVLYTCTPGGKTREAAFCDRVEQEESGVPEDKNTPSG